MEKKKRPRFEVRTGIRGSSDMRRVNSNRAELSLNHKQFVGSELYNAVNSNAASSSTDKEPLPTQMVEVLVRGKWITMEYSVVKAAGFKNWR